MLPKVLEIERHQLADYARVDYAITKGEDEIAALEELWLGLGPLRPAGQKDCTRPQRTLDQRASLRARLPLLQPCRR